MSLYEVAFHLKMPLYILREEMPYEELLGWYNYFERRPVGWQEDDRAFKLMQAQGAKAKAWEVFPSLKKIYQPDDGGLGDGMRGFKGSAVFQHMAGAVGGDKLDFLFENKG